MSVEITTIELERAEGWKGEIVDMQTFNGEVDYFECEVEAYAVVEIDDNYGADADGNRGATMDFSYIEDVTVFLDGDFRPKLRKVRDFFRGTLLGRKWVSFPDNCEFTRASLDEDILSESEKESVVDAVLGLAGNYEPDFY